MRGFFPQCPICKQPLSNNNCDLHEAIISRGQLNGIFETDLYVEENCVLRHHVCHSIKRGHEGGVGGQRIFELCLAQIVESVGGQQILNWLDIMQVNYPTVAKDAKQRVLAFLTPRVEGDHQ